MERILVAIDERRPQPEALAHGCSLASRIQASLHVLFITSGQGKTQPHPTRKNLELLVNAAKADGVHVEYFIAEGGYEDTVVTFVRTHAITLFIYEAMRGAQHASIRSASFLRALKHRIACRVEIITPQPRIEETKRG